MYINILDILYMCVCMRVTRHSEEEDEDEEMCSNIVPLIRSHLNTCTHRTRTHALVRRITTLPEVVVMQRWCSCGGGVVVVVVQLWWWCSCGCDYISASDSFYIAVVRVFS